MEVPRINHSTHPAEIPSIAFLGDSESFAAEAIRMGGGHAAIRSDVASGLVLGYSASPAQLRQTLESHPNLAWVQLPTAGIEAFADSLAARPDILWTSAKGAYAKPVAEHALALVLALLRELPARVVAKSWGRPAGASLHGLRAVVVGAGGVGVEIVRLLKAFDVHVTTIRRTAGSVVGADSTATLEHLGSLLPEVDVLVLAAALTPSTHHLLGAEELQAMKETAVLVNIGRGALIDTDALVDALRERRIAGVGLDVTEPEPLPDGHPLWDEPKCLITPHSADTMEMIMPLYAQRIAENVNRFITDKQLEGVVDPVAGY